MEGLGLGESKCPRPEVRDGQMEREGGRRPWLELFTE